MYYTTGSLVTLMIIHVHVNVFQLKSVLAIPCVVGTNCLITPRSPKAVHWLLHVQAAVLYILRVSSKSPNNLLWYVFQIKSVLNKIRYASQTLKCSDVWAWKFQRVLESVSLLFYLANRMLAGLAHYMIPRPWLKVRYL